MPLDDEILAVFDRRHGIPTVVRLSDGQMLPVKNVSYGYDEGSEWAHG